MLMVLTRCQPDSDIQRIAHGYFREKNDYQTRRDHQCMRKAVSDDVIP